MESWLSAQFILRHPGPRIKSGGQGDGEERTAALGYGVKGEGEE
jgi:hypothetical protein